MSSRTTPARRRSCVPRPGRRHDSPPFQRVCSTSGAPNQTSHDVSNNFRTVSALAWHGLPERESSSDHGCASGAGRARYADGAWPVWVRELILLDDGGQTTQSSVRSVHPLSGSVTVRPAAAGRRRRRMAHRVRRQARIAAPLLNAVLRGTIADCSSGWSMLPNTVRREERSRNE